MILGEDTGMLIVVKVFTKVMKHHAAIESNYEGSHLT